jgi:hypothetical protein
MRCHGSGLDPLVRRTDPDDPDKDDEEDQDEAGKDTEQKTKLCPVCRGLGRDSTGSRCARCGGSGRVPMDDMKEGDRYGGIYKFLWE